MGSIIDETEKLKEKKLKIITIDKKKWNIYCLRKKNNNENCLNFPANRIFFHRG